MLTATFKIKENIKNLADKVLNSLLRMPDTESFLPEGLKLQNLVFSGNLPDFSDFVNVSSIPARGIGKQLRVMYNSIINFQSGVTYLNKINSVLNALETIYQDFLNDNPDNCAVFEGNYENFSFRIELLDTSYFAVFRFVSAALEISYDAESQTNIGKIKITDGISAKYEIKDNFIKFALQATVANVGFLSQIEFNKTANGVKGSFYEFIGAENASIKTSALIVVGEKYTSVIADKRESDDMIVEGEVEVYESQSGRFIGSEIKETLKAVDYDTMWFNLKDVQGISSVRISEERNDLNLNTVYINGSETPFLPKKVGGLSLSMLSRRFDIEMKVMYFYVFDENTGKFKEQKTEIPMLFVQRNFLDSFSEDVKEKNSKNGIVGETKITLSEAEKSFIDKIYSVLTEDYKLLKNQVTFSSVQKFLDQ